MLHTFPDLEQRSEEWYAARRGIVTASAVGRLLTARHLGAIEYDCPECGAAADSPCLSKRAGATQTAIKTLHPARTARRGERPPALEPSDSDDARSLVLTLAAERITGLTEPSFINDDMMRGVLHEPVARDRYAEHNGVKVAEVGFMVRDDWGYRIGASPDGLVGADGGLEIKCPRAKAHIRTIVDDRVPPQYMAQVQTSLLVSGRKWWDYVSFCAGLPMWTKRVYPDPQWQAAVVDAVAAFEKATEQLISDYLAKSEGLPTTERIPDDIEWAA